MREEPILISNLNDFIFCPVSIYFHSLESDEENLLGQDSFQLNGTAAHEKSDSGKYSSRKMCCKGYRFIPENTISAEKLMFSMQIREY